VFDKTGTLTGTSWRIRRVETFGVRSSQEALHIAAAMERDSQHPLAAAFRAFDDHRPATLRAQQPGRGIIAVVGGRELRLGTADFASDLADDGAVWLGDGRAALARFDLAEQVEASAGPVLRDLQEGLRLQLHLLSGDGSVAVARCMDSLGVDFATAAARLLPEGKLARVRELQSRGHCVAMIGDGINDAPVLAGADVSIAVARGAPLAQRSADVVLLQPSLQGISAAIRTARQARRIMQQNVAWAAGYNLLALPLAATGHVVPWMAALAMVASSLTVTLNALRLTRAAGS
ncbi:MAG TPA: HAD-IC family P-type ATPase, partial [Steroidobacteraceae bacterium]|nr:HAD-IC family P-type ATPase [Steroidobacteraceae bacterium]